MGSDWRTRAKRVYTDGKPQEESWRARAVPVQNWVKELGSTVQEMHPDISLKDRWIVKNFSQDPANSIAYLKQQYPGLEFGLSNDGQLRARKPDDVWRAIDPDTGIISKDTLNDIGDIVYDLYAAGTEGAATVGGAAAGALGTLPSGGWGAIPGAMVASGATTAGNEAMRQKLGSWLGIPQDIDWGDVGVSGAIGTVAPVIAGVGKVPGLAERGAKLAGQAVSKANPLPWIGEKVSGVPREVLRNYYDDGVRANVDKLEKEGITDFSGQVYDKLKNYVESNKEKAGQELVDVMENMGKKVDIKDAKGAFGSARDEIMARAEDGGLTNADAKKLDKLNEIYTNYFGVQEESFLPDQIGAKKAWQLQKDLKQTAKYGSDMDAQELYSKGVSRDAYTKINEALDKASDGATTTAKDRYSAAMKEEAELLPKFEGKTRADSIQKTYNTMSGLDRQGRKVMQEKLSKLSDDEILNLVDEAKILSTYKWLGKPNIAPVSSGGTTSTSRTIPLAIAGGSLGSLAGYNTGGGYAGATVGGASGAALGTILGSPAALKAYIRAMRKAGRARELITPRGTPTNRAIGSGVTTEALDE